MNAVLGDPEIGWAGSLLFNERTGRLIDGHGRLKTVKPTDQVPVLIGSWSEDDERRILLTHDAITQMALPDADQLAALLADTALLGDLASIADQLRDCLDADAADTSARGEQGRTVADAPRPRLSIRCSSEEQQKDLLERLATDGIPCRALIG